MITAGFALGSLVASLHWWQFARQCRSMEANLATRRVLWSAAGRWGLTILLGVVCLSRSQVTYGDFMTGFLVASLVVRAVSLLRAKTSQRGPGADSSP